MSRRRSGLAVVAPAKVNLTLAVVGRRSDGYHALESVFARIGLDEAMFNARPFTRLKQLKYLISSGQIDARFFWTV